MPEVARIADTISCTDVINEGSADVFAEGMPISRIGQDLTAGHCFLPTLLVLGPANLSTVFVNDKPIAHKTDFINLPMHFCIAPPNIHPVPHTIITGAPSVFAYE